MMTPLCPLCAKRRFRVLTAIAFNHDARDTLYRGAVEQGHRDTVPLSARELDLLIRWL